MSQRLEKLRTTIADLEQELSGLDTLDAESRALLEEAATEIQSALHKNDHAALHTGSEPVAERLADAARSFESSHPTLAGVVQKLIDALAQLGI